MRFWHGALPSSQYWSAEIAVKERGSKPAGTGPPTGADAVRRVPQAASNKLAAQQARIDTSGVFIERVGRPFVGLSARVVVAPARSERWRSRVFPG